MDNHSLKNQKAWEYRAYEFWTMNYGTPQEKAAQIKKDPRARLRYHQKYFEHIRGLNIANVCGSNGRIAVPLALLGATVTIFDISAANKRYAMELADCAGVSIHYELGDFYDVDLSRFENCFDFAYLEGGVLHYFHDLERFSTLLYRILKPGGRLILSDFHPFRKIMATGIPGKNAVATGGNYFDCDIHDGEVAYKSYFPQSEQDDFPDCSLRFYTLSEILNSVIQAGFNLREFNEHPNWDDEKIPGEFTLYAIK
ncbi:MAG: class I SAM-dependent methyltransferase [Oscillospiraceae bacterium]|nr:class I SAM-dependent methyltransferase [Oscillospiraceae bacterium]